jgi:alpha 1,3-glucosidase
MTWDAALFPRPAEMQEDVASRGRKMVTIVDPHVKRDTSYYVHKEAQELGHYVRNKDGGEFDGWCWPGEGGDRGVWGVCVGRGVLAKSKALKGP